MKLKRTKEPVTSVACATNAPVNGISPMAERIYDLQIELPDRGPEEDDVTQKQLSFIHDLFDSIDTIDFSLDVESLGKRQASSLIDQLIEIRDNKSEISNALAGDGEDDRLSLGKLFVIGIALYVLWIVFT